MTKIILMINYTFIISVINIVATCIFILMLLTSWYYLCSFFLTLKKTPKVPHSDKKTKFAIIVPARYEAKVIRRNLESLLKQTYDKNYYDIWVIIESEEDPTFLICKALGINCFIRTQLEGRRKKGFAIQELYNYFIEKDLHYDSYMIFDADNIVSSRYVEIMNDLRQSGVQVGVGYRNYTNASKNWLTTTSAIFFTYMLSFTAHMRTIFFKKSTICGTGYFIDDEIVKSAGGWIFTGMTEDIQITTYCYYHNVNMCYYPYVDFYDEQCSTIKTTHKQMIRWIWGYFESKKAFKKGDADYKATTRKNNKLARFEFTCGIYPFVIFTCINFLLFLGSLIFCFTSFIFEPQYTGQFFGYTMVQFAILYGTYLIIAIAVIINDNKHLKFNFPTIVWGVLTYILFYGEILIALLAGLFSKKKRGTWEAIEHTGDLTNKEANNE